MGMAPKELLVSATLLFLLLQVATANLRHENVIDRCWRGQSNWANDRQRLPQCSVGFAGNMSYEVTAYTVTDPSDDPVRPRPGTLRYGATLLPGKVWIDHNTLSRCEDGLLDVTRSSTDVTISNNWFHDHDKVMLLGHEDQHVADRRMRVTVAFNRFGPNVSQRMPRIRHGYAHVVNNLYDGWREYAIGGSMGPTVKSQGNLFIASTTDSANVTRRMPVGDAAGEDWHWHSTGDSFENGAVFKQTGNRVRPNYNRDQAFPAASSSEVRSLTKDAGALRCSAGAAC
uniref:Pectate lyase n=1 Tax=Aegilops tauschii TaxID=37682 RepID=M8C0B6_AEGTA